MINIDVSIMGQSYRLACKKDEETPLREACAYLDEKMCAIRDAGKIRGNDRIAVMASIAIAAEMLSIRLDGGPLSGQTLLEVKQKVASMHEMLDQALAPQENLF